jgi:hypothetical protein
MAARLTAQSFPLTAGTVTDWGTIECSTLTAYKMVDGRFVPFTTVHERQTAEPLIVFGR